MNDLLYVITGNFNLVSGIDCFGKSASWRHLQHAKHSSSFSGYYAYGFATSFMLQSSSLYVQLLDAHHDSIKIHTNQHLVKQPDTEC